MPNPNILHVVWDACRYDYAIEYADTLLRLSDDNLWFEKTIAPAGWSLPSHVSMFSGDYPHEHEIYRVDQSVNSLPITVRLSEEGYRTYAVSSNGFISPRHGFETCFDEFYTTQGEIIYPQALDVYRFANKAGKNTSISMREIASDVISHPAPLKSAMNVASGILSKITNRAQFLQKIPHHRFSQFNGFNYTPESNTKTIESILKRESDSESPFYIFTNYADTHHPYSPPEKHQRETCGKIYSYNDLQKLNKLAYPWKAMEERKSIPDSELRKIRQLYAAELRSSDAHLNQLLDLLSEYNQLEDTLVIVTGDHGENLGEEDPLGERLMGHARSGSEELLHVPLLIMHPDLNGEQISERFSLRRIADLMTIQRDDLLSGQLPVSENHVFSETPLAGRQKLLAERYDLPQRLLDRSVSVGYENDWKIIITSDGEEVALKDGETVDINRAPDNLRESIEDNLKKLSLSEENESLDPDLVDQLGNLGYI